MKLSLFKVTIIVLPGIAVLAIFARKKCIAKKITNEKVETKEPDDAKTDSKTLKKVGKLVGKEIISEVLDTDADFEPNIEPDQE